MVELTTRTTQNEDEAVAWACAGAAILERLILCCPSSGLQGVPAGVAAQAVLTTAAELEAAELPGVWVLGEGWGTLQGRTGSWHHGSASRAGAAAWAGATAQNPGHG
jgi:hypothetical protein